MAVESTDCWRRATEMDVTMIGLQNAGKTSLLRVLAVRSLPVLMPLARGNKFELTVPRRREENSQSSKSNALHVRYLLLAISVSANSGLRSSIPTVGFNMKRVQRGHVTLKCWDIGGQPRFRTMWERYCRGVNAIVFIVDIADLDVLEQARDELHALMGQGSLLGIPLLVLGNKSDLPEKLSVDELIDALDLKTIGHREVCCYGISAKEETNLDAVIQWLMKWANR